MGVDAWLAIVVIRFTRVSAMVGGSCAIRLATWSCNGFLVREKKMINILSQAVGIKQNKDKLD